MAFSSDCHGVFMRCHFHMLCSRLVSLEALKPRSRLYLAGALLAPNLPTIEHRQVPILHHLTDWAQIGSHISIMACLAAALWFVCHEAQACVHGSAIFPLYRSMLFLNLLTTSIQLSSLFLADFVARFVPSAVLSPRHRYGDAQIFSD